MCESGKQTKNEPPQILTLESCGGDWEKYIEEVYQCYIIEIVKGKLFFRGLPIRCQFRPVTKGKHFAFWHMISEGRTEEERTPDLRRCERIKWISWVIRNADVNNKISDWENKRGSNKNIVLWYEEGKFAVILTKRPDYLLLKTAYCVDPHREKTFRRERDEYIGKND